MFRSRFRILLVATGVFIRADNVWETDSRGRRSTMFIMLRRTKYFHNVYDETWSSSGRA